MIWSNSKKRFFGGDVYLSDNEVNALVDAISNQPTIDPETLPIVQELRAELEKAKKERDEFAALCGKLVVLCEPPQKWR